MPAFTATLLRPTHTGRTRSTIARRLRRARGVHDQQRAFTPLIDAKAASLLLGVPYTWLLAQARARRIPHHRLGHYVRFNPDDLAGWLQETKTTPRDGRIRAHPRRP